MWWDKGRGEEAKVHVVRGVGVLAVIIYGGDNAALGHAADLEQCERNGVKACLKRCADYVSPINAGKNGGEAQLPALGEGTGP